MSKNLYRPDKDGTHRPQFEINKKKLLAVAEVCALCGRPIDKSLKWPHKYCAVVDHIIPIAKGGHPSDISNLQVVHNCCNALKGSRIIDSGTPSNFNAAVSDNDKIFPPNVTPSNRELPLSVDWLRFGTVDTETLKDEIQAIESGGNKLYADGIHRQYSR